MLKLLKYSPYFRPVWVLISLPIALFLLLRCYLAALTSQISVDPKLSQITEPTIFTNWHQHLPYLLLFNGKRRNTIMVSAAPYMEPIALFCRFCGLKVIRGGSGQNGASALDGLLQTLRNGRSVMIAVDGPSGPIFKMKRGYFELARETGYPVMHLAYQCKKAKPNYQRWDQMLMPGFFDRIVVTAQGPFSIGKGADFADTSAQIEALITPK